MSLNDLEHGILRSNTRPPYHITKPPFGMIDSRKKLCIKKFGHHIHFALNNGAKSCPPVKKYSAVVLSIKHCGWLHWHFVSKMVMC